MAKYGDYETLMMSVIDNINNKIIPVHLPYEHQSFLTPEIIQGVIDAISFNDNYKLFHSFRINPQGYFEGVLMNCTIYYHPFDIEPEIETTSQKLSSDFVFTLDNTSLYYYRPATIETQLRDIEDLNRTHRFFHSLGLEPYAMTNRDGINKFSGLFYTKKDYYPSVNASSWDKSNYPIKPKIHYFNDDADEDSFRQAFGFPPHPGGGGNMLFSVGSPKDLDDVLHSTIRMFRARSEMGFTIKTPSSGEVLPYYNKSLYYCNPHYGYYDNYYNVKPFMGGGVGDDLKPYINGTLYANGFNVVWFTDTEFWITLKYIAVYTDKRAIQQYDPTLCCLAQCFGITN